MLGPAERVPAPNWVFMGKSRGLDEVVPPGLSSYISVFSPFSFLPMSSDFPPFPPPLPLPSLPADLLSALLHQSRGGRGVTPPSWSCPSGFAVRKLLPVKVTQLLPLSMS